MTDNGLAQFFGVTQNEYTILEALYTQILTSDWTHKMPQAGMLNNKADSPICDHLSPYHEEGIDNIPLKELLTTDRVVEYKTDDPYGVYLTIAGTNKRYSFLWNAARYSDRLFIVYQLGAKPTKNAPELGYVQGVLVRMSGMVKGCNPLFIEALRVYEQILEFHVLPRNGKEDIVPTPAEVLAILQGYGEYPGIDSVLTTGDKKKSVKDKKEPGGGKDKPDKGKKRSRKGWSVLLSTFLFLLPFIVALCAYVLTGKFGVAALIAIVGCAPFACYELFRGKRSEGEEIDQVELE
jgi:hypothetical protein